MCIDKVKNENQAGFGNVLIIGDLGTNNSGVVGM